MTELKPDSKIAETTSKQSKTVAIQEEVPVPSLEECNLTIPRDEVEQEISKIDLKEKVEQTKSQEAEELNRAEE